MTKAQPARGATLQTVRDTTAEAARVQAAALARLDGPTRLRQALELSETTRALAFARLEARHPALGRRELIAHFLRETLSPHELPPFLR